jgi:hypothetical protein
MAPNIKIDRLVAKLDKLTDDMEVFLDEIIEVRQSMKEKDPDKSYVRAMARTLDVSIDTLIKLLNRRANGGTHATSDDLQYLKDRRYKP